MQRKHASTVFLLVSGAILLYLCFLLSRPFLESIFLAVLFAIVCRPVNSWIQMHVHRRNLAALFSTILVLCLLVIPTIGLAIVLKREVLLLFQSVEKSSAEHGSWAQFVVDSAGPFIDWMGKHFDLSELNVRAEMTRWLNNITQTLSSLETSVLSNVFGFIGNTVIMFYTLFFLFREDQSMKQHFESVLPLSSDQVNRLFTGVDNSVIANVYGCVAVGLAQGILTGLAFWVLGIPKPILWGIVTGLFSLIPVIGSGAVWGPAVIILFVTGHWIKGLILIGWGAIVVAQVDNLVRPYIMSRYARMHPLLIFFALLGGVEVFGALGVFVGPVVVSVTIVIFEMLKEMNQQTSDGSSMSKIKLPQPL